MKAILIGMLATSVVLSPAAAKPRLSDAQIKRTLIQQSIANYPGNCPCPYNTARNGSACGGRSAWSRAGGYAPLCYPSDVTKADVERYKQEH